MLIPHFSPEGPERLANKEAINRFKNLMLRHGALGRGRTDLKPLDPSEIEAVVPLIFGFIPESAIRERPVDLKVKPLIRIHLESLRIEYDEELVSIIKALSDQYYATSSLNNLAKPRKFSMSDIRSNGAYRDLIQRQNHRCSICGHSFRDHGGETLDHIIPWRLIGDNQDGSNWQILCSDCNSGKSAYLTHLMLLASKNWMYGNTPLSDKDYSNQVRFSVLMRDGRCTFPSCNATPKTNSLTPTKVIDSGLGLYDFLTTRCERHKIRASDC